MVAAPRRTPLLVGAGRTALVVAALVWLAAALFGTDDLSSATSPLGPAYVGTAVAFAMLAPWLLLPVGTSAHATYDDDGVLSVVTVLGVQHIDLGDLRRVGALKVYWRAGYDQYLYLRGPGPRMAWLMLDDTRSLSGHALTQLARTTSRRPEIVTARGRALLRIDPRPGLAHRFALGASTGVVATVVLGCWTWVVLYTFLAVPF